MASSSADDVLDIGKVPIIDLRSLCQDEIRYVAQLSGGFSEDKMNDIVNFAIDKAIFNESSGSRRQTYARDRIPRRSQYVSDSVPFAKPRLPSSLRNATHPVAQVATDSKDKRSYRENQDLIVRMYRKLQIDEAALLESAEKPLLGENKPSSDSVKGRASVRTSIIAGGEVISVLHSRRDDSGGHDRSTAELEPEVRANGLHQRLKQETAGAKKQDSIRLKRIARGIALQSGNPSDAGKAQVGLLHRLSKKMKPKEHARRSIFPREVNGEPSNRYEFKVVDAEGFPIGWKACFGLANKGSSKIIKYISPDGHVWSSRKKALAHAGSAFGTDGSDELKPSEPALTRSAGPTHYVNEASEPLESRDANFTVHKKGGALRYPVCVTCGKTFANQFSLKRHMKSARHGAYQANGAALETTIYGKAKRVGVTSNKGPDNIDEQYESGLGAKEKVGHREGNMAASNMETFKCKTCEKLFTSRRKYLTHLRVHSPKNSHRGRLKRFQCRKCHMKFDRRYRYVSHLNKHSTKGSKKAGGLESRKVGRPPGKVVNGPMSRPPKSKKAGNSSNASAIKEINFAKGRAHMKWEAKAKLSGSKFICNACGVLFNEYLTYKEHRCVHSKKNKRKRENEHLGRQVKSYEERAKAQAIIQDASMFTCQECGKVFDEHARYTGHLSVHSRMRRKLAKVAIHSTAGGGKGGSVVGNVANQDNDEWDAFDSQESATVVFWRLVAETTGVSCSGLPAKLLFGSINTFGSQKVKESIEEDTIQVGHHQNVLHSSFQAGDSICRNLIEKGSRLEGESLFPLHDLTLLSWSMRGCPMGEDIGGHSKQHVVCNWCDRDFHQSCSMQSQLIMPDTWFCPSCVTDLSSLGR